MHTSLGGIIVYGTRVNTGEKSRPPFYQLADFLNCRLQRVNLTNIGEFKLLSLRFEVALITVRQQS